MKLSGLHGFDKAYRTAQKYLTPRFRQLDKLERYVAGTQYEGRVAWLDPNGEVPMLDRAPCVRDRSADQAIESFCSLLVGDERWPEITSRPEETDQGFDAIVKLSDDESDTLDRGIKAIVKHSKLKRAATEALRYGMECGTAVSIYGVRNGRLVVDNTLAKWCLTEADSNGGIHTEFDVDGNVTRLVLQYPYLERFWDAEVQKWAVRAMLFRRVIDAQGDTTMLPMVAPESGEPVRDGAWKPDPKRTTLHGYGFCPVVWYCFDKRETTVAECDGRAIHQGLLSEIDSLCRSQSQHHRAALYAGDPQFVETGVDEDHNPAPMGQQPSTMQAYPDEDPAAGHRDWLTGPPVSTSGRKKGPGVVWRYPTDTSKVEILTLPGDALDSVAKDREDLRHVVAEAMEWVRLDPANLRGNLSSAAFSNMSGAAIRLLLSTQLNRAAKLRGDFRDGWLLPTMSMLLRVVLHHSKGGGLYLPGAEKIAAVAAKFLLAVGPQNDNAGDRRWFAPDFTLQWPEFIPRTPEEWKVVAEQVRADHKEGLITTATAVKKLQQFYGIEDVDAYLEELSAEADEKQERAMEQMKAEAGAMHSLVADEDGDRPPPNKQPKPPMKAKTPGKRDAA